MSSKSLSFGTEKVLLESSIIWSTIFAEHHNDWKSFSEFMSKEIHRSEIEQLMVIADNTIYWNSTYSMIEQAMQLKDLTDLFAARSFDNDMT